MSEPMSRYGESALSVRAYLDNMSAATADPGQRDPLRDHQRDCDDPVIQQIDRLIEPKWVDGPMHAKRLRALAESEAIFRHVDVASWLLDLANIIEEMS